MKKLSTLKGIYEKDKPYKSTLKNLEKDPELDESKNPLRDKNKGWLFYYSEFFESRNEDDMEPQGIDQLFEQNKDLARKSKNLNLVSSKLLHTFFGEKLQLIKEIIQQLKDEIQKRNQLGKEFSRELNGELETMSVILRDLSPGGRTGYNITQERMHVERNIELLKERKRVHKTRTWRDLIWLKKELIQLLVEYKELLRLKELIDYGENRGDL